MEHHREAHSALPDDHVICLDLIEVSARGRVADMILGEAFCHRIFQVRHSHPVADHHPIEIPR